jgi:hypothetical protein
MTHGDRIVSERSYFILLNYPSIAVELVFALREVIK